MKPAPILRYPGSKWRLAPWIAAQLPVHRVYLEPFFGSGAVFFSKPPAPSEVVNDLSGEVVNLFRVVREQPEALAAAVEMTPWAREEYEAAHEEAGDPLERARRFLVRSWQGFGARQGQKPGWRHDAAGLGHGPVALRWRGLPDRILAACGRLLHAQIENRPAVEVIRRYADPAVLVYADPPYLPETRTEHAHYAHEMSREDHEALLGALLAHPGPVVLSGYASALYDDALRGWRRVTAPGFSEAGAKREEVLWVNRASEARQGCLF
jgi:DNA adenine methylase